MRTPRLPAVDWTDAPTARFKWTRPFRRKTKSGFKRGLIRTAQVGCYFLVSYTMLCQLHYAELLTPWRSVLLEKLTGSQLVQNAMKINPSKSKAFRFTRVRVKDPLNYSLMGTLMPEASSCKYLGIILRSNLSWADQVNYRVKKAWKALHFTMRILKKGNSNTRFRRKTNSGFWGCAITFKLASSCKYLRIILSSDLSWADQDNYKAWKALHFTMRILKTRNSNNNNNNNNNIY